MEHRRPPVQVIVLVIVIVLALGAYYIYTTTRSVVNGGLTASGTVETTEIAIAPELSGKVADVLVNEGDPVKVGQILFRLDDTLIKAQRNVAAASLEAAKSAAATASAAVGSAQAQYDITHNAALTQDKPNIRTSNWVTSQSGEFNVPRWYFSQAEQITGAQTEVDAAKAALTDFQEKLLSVQSRVSSADFVKAESALAAAQASYEVANNLNNRVQNGKNIDDLSRRQLFLLARDAANIARERDPKWVLASNISKDLRDAARKIYDDAKSNLKDAQDAYDDAVTTEGAKDVFKARAQVSVAEERYYTALDYYRMLETGVDSPAVTASQKVLDQVVAAAAQAQTAVSQAQANLDLIDAQVEKLTVAAPADGVILTRSVEPGEVVNPGSVLLTLGRLADLTITVYVPEDSYGQIKLGQAAEVKVDSFPGMTFKATVVHISDSGEFTPRNVQTAEGRKATVYAIKLQVADPDGNLKPGMPADVTFK